MDTVSKDEEDTRDWTGQNHDFQTLLFWKTVIVYSLKHIQYLRWMEREISYTEWWSRHDFKLLCNAGLDPYPGTEHTKQTFVSKTGQNERCCISHTRNLKPKKRNTKHKRRKENLKTLHDIDKRTHSRARTRIQTHTIKTRWAQTRSFSPELEEQQMFQIILQK